MEAQTQDHGPLEILIAEDSATQAEQLRHLLEQHGYIVTAAANGRQALEAARQRKPTLIISDIVMPEMDGYALCKAVKSDGELRDVPVLIVTTLSSIQDIATSLECGADNFIRKPYDPAALISRIDHILSNQKLRKASRPANELEIYLAGKKHVITSAREQILDLLISSYEQAIQVNEELKDREREVSMLNFDLRLRAAELESANQELESFSYSVSHDLRAPLRAIDGFCRILEEDHAVALDAEGRRLLTTVRGNALRMGQLIEDLLEFSRTARAPINCLEVEMTRLAQEVFGELRDSASTTPACEIEPLPIAWGDRTLLRQVWVNLLSNAVKYSSQRKDPAIRVNGYREGNENVYCVTDNGAGFDMEYADRLFGVFQRLHRSDEFPGTGVGLAIVRRIVTRHEGRVWARSKRGEGASFFFTLPVHAPQ